MAARHRVKELKRMAANSGGVNAMFKEMMGLEDADPAIIIPKFVNTRNTLRQIYKVLIQFSGFVAFRTDFPEVAKGLDEIKTFAEEMKESTYLQFDHEEEESQYYKLSKQEINKIHKKLKNDKYVKELIVLCSKLKLYRTNFEDPNNLKENFVNQEPGLEFRMFDFSSLDLKMLWSNEKMKPSVKKYILMVFANLFKHIMLLYKLVTSADIDTKKFAEVVVACIKELKNQPTLARCTNAFTRIEKSVNLLEDRFDDYYRESIASENPNMMMLNFIVDVSNQNQGSSAQLTREFRLIIGYMRDSVTKNGQLNKDPTLKRAFDVLNQNFKVMETYSEKALAKERKMTTTAAKNNTDKETDKNTDASKDTDDAEDNKSMDAVMMSKVPGETDDEKRRNIAKMILEGDTSILDSCINDDKTNTTVNTKTTIDTVDTTEVKTTESNDKVSAKTAKRRAKKAAIKAGMNADFIKEHIDGVEDN